MKLLKKKKRWPGAVAHTCIPSTLGSRCGSITRSRDQDHPGQHSETASLLKIKKISWAWWCAPVIPATSGGCGRRIAWTQEVEVAVSWDRALQPGWQGKTLSQNKTNRQTTKKPKTIRWNSDSIKTFERTCWMLWQLKEYLKVIYLFIYKGKSKSNLVNTIWLRHFSKLWVF